MGDDSKASCLTATSTIVVAIVGASATVIVALITLWNKPTPPDNIHSGPTAISTPAPEPTGNRLRDDEPPPRTPTTASRIEGTYALQSQNVFSPMQATMTITQESEVAFRWHWNYTYAAYPYSSFQSTGEFVSEQGQWLESMDGASEPGAQTFTNLAVNLTLNRNILTITDNDGHEMIWRKR